jgi:hypothetical protein
MAQERLPLVRLPARVWPAADDDLQPLRVLGASRALGRPFPGVGAVRAIGGHADDRLGTRQSARHLAGRLEKKHAVGLRAEGATRRLVHSQMLKAKATIGSLKLGCADGIKTRICEDVATLGHIVFCNYPGTPQCGMHPRDHIGSTCRLLVPDGDSASRAVRTPAQVLGGVR